MGADQRRTFGQRGEAAVERWYSDAGYRIVERNWRCPEGEIDVIARSPQGVAVIIEVKTRTSAAFGSPFEAVTMGKQRRLRRVATRWLATQASTAYTRIRFDVAAVTVGEEGTLVLDILEDAF